MDGDVSWFSSGESYAWDQEYNMAALALVYHATSTSSEADLKHLMKTIVSTTPDFTEKDSDFRPPRTWSTTEQSMVKKVKELLIESMPWDTKGTTAPVIHVGIHCYSIYTTSNVLNKWCKRLCASKDDKNPKPLLAPSWDKNKKLRFTLMLPQLARHILTKFGTMYAQLQAAVDALPMAAVTGPSPTKSELKKKNIGLATKIDALTAVNADLAAENDDLQSAVDRKVCTSYHALYIGTRSSDFSSDFLGFFCSF